jgi:hypothetical protein
MRPRGVFAVIAAALAAGCGSSSGAGPVVDASTEGAPSTAEDGASTSDGDATTDAAWPDGEAMATDAASPHADASLDAAPDASTGAGGDGADDGECAHAGDCHLFSACDSCTCLAQTGTGPVCTGTPVECLVAPCGSKTAACNQGHCAVQP